MGDLVLDRLAARGVDPSSLEWSATREVSEPWQIAVTFVQGAAEYAAHWSLSASGTLKAIDQEAQWLTEQVSSSPTASIFTPLPRAAAPDPGGEDLRAREALVDQLNAARGKRQRVEVDLGEEDEEAEYLAAISASEPEEREPEASTGPISARIYSLASARTKGEPSDQAEAPSYPAPPEPPAARPTPDDAAPGHAASQGVLPWLSESSSPDADAEEPETPAIPMRAVSPEDASPTDAEEPPTTGSVAAQVAPTRMARPASKKGRRSVPSWDEILFGSKP